MRTSEEIFRDLVKLITAEVRNNANFRETFSGESGKATAEARIALLPLLQEAAGLRDIDLLLNIELTFWETELEHLVHTRESLDSFNLAIRQIRAAITMLKHVRAPDEYRWAEAYFTLPDNLTARGLPKDEALAMLKHVRVPDEYRWAEAYFTLPDNLTARGLPKDEAHQCMIFVSHESRLRNLLKLPPEKERAALIKSRISNIKLAKDIYTDLQRR